MKPFKFFQKDTRATESFNADTPEGYYARRHLYHTQRDLYERLRNNDMDRYYYDRELGRFETIERRPEIVQEVTRRINGGSRPTKIKTVLKESWLYDPIGVVFVSILATIITIIGIAKILNIW